MMVTGLPRSATRYLARVLFRLDVTAGHEGVFRFRHCWDQVEIRANGLDVDVSWLAAPFLSTLHPDTRIGVQMRDPLNVLNSIASQVSRSAWANPEPYLDAGQWVETIIGEAPSTEPRDQALHFYVAWLRLIRNALQHREHRNCAIWSVEQITPQKLAFLLAWAQLRDIGPWGGALCAQWIDKAAAALAAIPTNENHHGSVRHFFNEPPAEALRMYKDFLQ